MALTGIQAMCGGRNSSGYIGSGCGFQRTVRKYPTSLTCGMANESDWTKHRKSLAYAAQVISSATLFIPWSRKIPIGVGYHEFL
ncbi:hypothetical protein Ancab_021368 [Ancistrocladus abbreviatus]